MRATAGTSAIIATGESATAGGVRTSCGVRLRTARPSQLRHSWQHDEGKVLPLFLRSGAVRLKPSLRVRLHGRNRLPELAVMMSLATIALLLGASYFTPASGGERSLRAESDGGPVIEMRSAATSAMPVRKDVRIIRFDRSPLDDGRKS
jgi:hypothetical protein